jgi:hypothetical protein
MRLARTRRNFRLDRSARHIARARRGGLEAAKIVPPVRRDSFGIFKILLVLSFDKRRVSAEKWRANVFLLE